MTFDHIEWVAEPVPNISKYDTYEEAREEFRWDIPDEFNLSHYLIHRHRTNVGQRPAVIEEDLDHEENAYTYDEIGELSTRLASRLADFGLERGDRLAFIGSQKVEAVITQVACYQLGAIYVPLSILFGSDSLEYHLSDSGADIVIAEDQIYPELSGALSGSLSLERVIGIDDGRHTGEAPIEETFWPLDEPELDGITDTAPTDPALMLYTSGTTGEPKGVLHSHQSVLGCLPPYQMFFEVFWQRRNDLRFYSPADWAWAGGLYNILLPSLYYGFTVVGNEQSKFDPRNAFALIDKYDITQVFLAPTMLKMMDQVEYSDYSRNQVAAVMSAGEPVQKPVHEIVREMFDAPLLEQCGSTEALQPLATCSRWFDPVPGAPGKPVPGRDARVVDEHGNRKSDGEIGRLQYLRDPGMFLEYWERPTQTAEAFIDDWFDVGDLGYRDENGYFWFVSRADDLIISSGYRIGPGEVEDVILEHGAVVDVGVTGKAHDTRGEIVKAVIVLNEEVEPSEALKSDIQNHVKDVLAKHKYPREIEFVSELPTTTTGKVQRKKL